MQQLLKNVQWSLRLQSPVCLFRRQTELFLRVWILLVNLWVNLCKGVPTVEIVSIVVVPSKITKVKVATCTVAFSHWVPGERVIYTCIYIYLHCIVSLYCIVHCDVNVLSTSCFTISNFFNLFSKDSYNNCHSGPAYLLLFHYVKSIPSNC